MTKPRFFILLGSLMLLIACFAKDPSDVVESFHSRIEAGKLDAAIELLSNGTRSQIEPAKLKQGLQQGTREIDSKGGIQKIQIIDEKIIGETAEVTVKIVYGDGTEQTDRSSLIKEDGKWRIQPSNSGK